MSDPLLVTEGLTKVFRRRFLGGKDLELRAVEDLSIAVARGAVYGFLGPNGAGKSTTLRMALGLIHPTAGRVSIGGHDLATQRLLALRKVGAFVESPSFYPFLSGRKNLEIFSSLSGGATRADLDAALERVGLHERADDRVSVYSHGMKARLGLAACLLPKPELLILDEPTDGLDPHGIHEVRALIRRLASEEGLTVFLSSHMLGEVENLCTHIGILERGRLILDGRLDELEREHRLYRLEVDRPAEATTLLRAQLGLETQAEPGGAGLLVALKGKPPEAVSAALMAAGLALRTFGPEPAWLDRLFLERTTSRESDRPAGKTGEAA
jgi:ABC-type multidrug transport system ATPase subunit